ncbi:conserved hypothetical protein [Lodderomyces elongisporus NRRL YB-4239]|uniref:Octanoyltransferase n=1 Tax=Lodderomyces elongisporus (strain ATCC 11503 / CBS 2605 / JCM 1781 / NBRC 1676 / NRRL YB-4239) TaxID=379508 RepID=A5DVZ5_LODEL|nr:conserved hypothetical protein [Lodderomyces elongisporus NRRL YB-4239]
MSCTPRSTYHAFRESYNTLQHLHFPGISTFQHGLNVQNLLMQYNLDYKHIESGFRRLGKLQLEPKHSSPIAIESDSNLSFEKWQSKLEQLRNLKPQPSILTFQFQHTYAGGIKSKKTMTDAQIAAFQSIREEGTSTLLDLLLLILSLLLSQTRASLPPPRFYQLDRGGQVTYHGPGQLVAYLVLDIKAFDHLTAKCYVNNVLLKLIQNVLMNEFGIVSYLLDENPGIWVYSKGWDSLQSGPDEVGERLSHNWRKIASVGVKVRRGVTEYGIALNVDPSLIYLNTFEMCGLKDRRATSIKEILSKRNERIGDKNNLSVDKVADLYAKQVAHALNMNYINKTIL